LPVDQTQSSRPSEVGGYHGSYLAVRLDDRRADGVSVEHVPLSPADLRKFIGGAGLGVQILLTLEAAACEPLAPDAPLAFVFSPLVGSPLTTSAKFAVVSRSPLTERINDSLASSGFAIAGKKAGCDALVVLGQAARPSILVVDNGQVRLEPAGDLWGQSCSATQQALRRRFGGDWRSAVIGPAGEKRVRYATISHDGRHAGRGGSGAVLGAKNIKAIVVRGDRACRWTDPGGLAAYSRQLSRASMGAATAKYRELGTASNLLLFNRLKTLPTRNFQQGSFAQAASLAPETLSATHQRTRASCAACTIGCEHIYSLRGDSSERLAGVRLEYENLFALGPLCGVHDAELVLQASQRCDELGLDTISAGGTIAFAMECVERGYLDASWSWLRFGDGSAVLRALDAIGRRDEFGDRLAEGSRRLAEDIGHDSLDFAPQVKGLELPGYEPRGLQTMALGFAVGTRGADHNRSGAYEVDFSNRADRRRLDPRAAALAIETEDKAALMDSLILCKFLRGAFDDFFAAAAEMLHLVTGWDTTAAEMQQTSQRIVAARKWFNIQAGWTPAEDTLPARFLRDALQDDAESQLNPAALQAAICAYNRQRGWSDDGWIDAALIEQLL